MKRFWNFVKQDIHGETEREQKGVPGHVLGFPIDAWPARQSDETIQVDSCAPFETLVVKTSNSVYEVIVLSGRDGEVLVRGGRFFPEFRRATLAGSTVGGNALKLRSIEVGLRLELRADGKAFSTSPVQALSQQDKSAATFPLDHAESPVSVAR